MSDLYNLKISDHALEAFSQRWIDPVRPKDWEKAFRKTLSHAKEISKKTIDWEEAKNFNESSARYFKNSGWIFVINKELTTVITVWRRNAIVSIPGSKKSKKKRFYCQTPGINTHNRRR